jgi:hypothetical protein
LNDFGVGVFREGKVTPQARAARLKKGRRALLKSAPQCTRCCEWLRDLEPTTTINPEVNSFDLRRVAELDIGYITHGVLIAAAIHSGFAYRLARDGTSVNFGISSKSIAAIKRRQHAEGKGNWLI